MELLIVASLDGNGMSQELQRSLQGFTPRITSMTLHDFTASSNSSTDMVIALILTPIMDKDLTGCTGDHKKRLLATPSHLIVLYCGDGDMQKVMLALFPRTVGDVSPVHLFDVRENDPGQWYSAEAAIKTQLQNKIKRGPPSRDKFVLLPEVITKDVDLCTIACVEDYSSACIATVRVGTKEFPAKPILPMVRTFKPNGLSSGKHTMEVFIDKVSIGTASLEVRDDVDVICSAIQRALDDNPLGYLARMLSLNPGNFDEEMVHFLEESGDNGFRRVEDLLKQGDDGKQGYIYPTLFHLCGKFGLSKTANMILHNKRDPNTLLRTRSRKGQTPADVASVNNYEDTEKILTPDIDRDTVPLQSPVNKKVSSSFKKTLPWDSGTSTTHSLSSGSEGEASSAGDSRGEWKNTSMQKDTKQPLPPYCNLIRQHPYDSIEEGPYKFKSRRERPYDEPWSDTLQFEDQCGGDGSYPKPLTRRVSDIPCRRKNSADAEIPELKSLSSSLGRNGGMVTRF